MNKQISRSLQERDTADAFQNCLEEQL